MDNPIPALSWLTSVARFVILHSSVRPRYPVAMPRRSAMRYAATITVLILTIGIATAIEITAPYDFSNIEFGDTIGSVRNALPHLDDHDSGSSTALKGKRFRWQEVDLASIFWFDEDAGLRSVMFLIQPNGAGRVEPGFASLRTKLLKSYGDSKTEETRAGGYTRLEWNLESSFVHLTLIPEADGIAEHAILSYAAPRPNAQNKPALDNP